MKIRIKFKKYDEMRFIGHLDMMRFFQKALRRAKIPVAFSEGYSPHIIMSFANPLSLGLAGEGEYFDLELTSPMDIKEIVERLNHEMVHGVEIVDGTYLKDGAKTGMALVEAADYLVLLNHEKDVSITEKMIDEFLFQKEILMEKKTKRSQAMIDIRPMIYEMEKRNSGIFMKISTGSKENLKPSLVMEALCSFLGIPKETGFHLKRLELYGKNEEGMHKPLIECVE